MGGILTEVEQKQMSQQHTRKVEILIETHDMTTIRTRHRSSSAYCKQCDMHVATFTTAQMQSWLTSLENGDAHLIESGNGPLVCANSLEGKTL